MNWEEALETWAAKLSRGAEDEGTGWACRLVGSFLLGLSAWEKFPSGVAVDISLSDELSRLDSL
jgi:hypothetical protein